ncbi:MAG TPA: hypothetical protein VF207_04435 [Chthoniobacterales bacterium]
MYYTRQFRAAERTYTRLIGLLPDQPVLKLQVADMFLVRPENDTAVWSAIAALPASMADGGRDKQHRKRVSAVALRASFGY